MRSDGKNWVGLKLFTDVSTLPRPCLLILLHSVCLTFFSWNEVESRYTFFLKLCVGIGAVQMCTEESIAGGRREVIRDSGLSQT